MFSLLQCPAVSGLPASLVVATKPGDLKLKLEHHEEPQEERFRGERQLLSYKAFSFILNNLTDDNNLISDDAHCRIYTNRKFKETCQLAFSGKPNFSLP